MKAKEFDIRAFLSVLRRRFPIVAAIVCVVMVMTAGGLYIIKPVYSSTALVLVDLSSKDLLDPDTLTRASPTESPRVDSEVEIARSDSTLMAVAINADLINNPEYRIRTGLIDGILEFLRLKQPRELTADEIVRAVVSKLSDSLTIQRRGLTYLVSIQARSIVPQSAADIANTVAKTYIRQQLAAKIDAVLFSRDAINSRLQDAKSAVAEAEQAFDHYLEQNIASISEATGRDDLLLIQHQIDAAVADRAKFETTISLSETALARTDWDALSRALDDVALSQLATEFATLTASLNTTLDAEEATTLTAQIAALEQKMRESAASDLTALNAKLQQAQKEASDLRASLQNAVLNADLSGPVLTQIYEIQQSAEIARNQYQALLQRSKALDAQASLQVADSRLVSAAQPSLQPAYPNTKLVLAVTAILSLVLGIVCAFIYENFIGGVSGGDHLQRLLGAAHVTSLPQAKALKQVANGGPSFSLADLVSAHPLSPFSEAFRRILVGIDHSLRNAAPGAGDEDSNGVIVMVTSALPGEGKTTVALGLARTYGLAGKTTLLIDCDLRRPGLHLQLGRESSVGLLEYLAETKSHSLSDILAGDPLTGVRAVLGARASSFATDQLLNRKVFEVLLAAARRAFDFVIIDTPPVGVVVDAIHLARYADAIVFVARNGVTPQRDIRQALQVLNQGKRQRAEIIGLLNREARRSQLYGGRYGEYYGAS